MILISDPSPATDTATDILFRSTTDRLASHCRSPVVSGSHLNWKRLVESCPTRCERSNRPAAANGRPTRNQAGPGDTSGYTHNAYRPQLLKLPGADPHAGWCRRGAVKMCCCPLIPIAVSI